jgi:hypothetical protein
MSELPAVSFVICRPTGNFRTLYHRLTFQQELSRFEKTARMDEIEIASPLSHDALRQTFTLLQIR